MNSNTLLMLEPSNIRMKSQNSIPLLKIYKTSSKDKVKDIKNRYLNSTNNSNRKRENSQKLAEERERNLEFELNLKEKF